MISSRLFSSRLKLTTTFIKRHCKRALSVAATHIKLHTHQQQHKSPAHNGFLGSLQGASWA